MRTFKAENADRLSLEAEIERRSAVETEFSQVTVGFA